VLAIPLWRIAFPVQHDDAAHLKRKRAYLERLSARAADLPRGPNVVLILFDDLGYGDLGVYGGQAIRTPRLDDLASRGTVFRNAYAASSYCSASRAALLTGRYAPRTGLDFVLQPSGTSRDLLIRLGGLNRRLPAEEITLADVLSAAGYATAIFGKWHLGEASPSLPDDLGFDTFYGLLYSNDQGEPAVYEDRRVVEQHPVDQTTLTRRYTERAVSFIERHAHEPFFLYLPHTFPHVPLHVSEDRLGRSPAGLYGDVVEELDESVGVVLDALEANGVAGETLVLVTSDNGPWFQGSPGGIRGRKMDVFEGGMRVPLLAAWAGHVAAGRVVDEPVVGVDLFPTVLELAGLPGPDDRLIDGESLAGVLRGEDWSRGSPVFYQRIFRLEALREGRFKYHARHGVFYGNPMDWAWGPMSKKGPWLFDLERDPDESYDVSAAYPDVARRLGGVLAERARQLEENPRGWLDVDTRRAP